VIQRNARLQLRVVDDLLDISRIVSGKMKISTDIVDLRGIVTAAADSVRPLAQAKPLQLDVVLPPDRVVVRGDAARLQQVIWNLVSNAIKFTPAEGRVVLELAADDRVARIVVTDTGQGIAPEFLPLVFDRFRQADASTTRRQGGLGLGLSVVRHLVEAHGGSVTVESAGTGRGATSTVTVPVVPQRAEVGHDGR
jgi:signal transduction histidine kinase